MKDNKIIYWKQSPLCIFFNKITCNLLLKVFTLRATWFLALAALCRAVIPSLALKSKCAPPFFRAFITSTVLSSWAAKVRGVSTEENRMHLEKGEQNYKIKLLHKIMLKILFKEKHKIINYLLWTAKPYRFQWLRVVKECVRFTLLINLSLTNSRYSFMLLSFVVLTSTF